VSTTPPLDTVREVLTPEGVVLRLQVAGPFPRALAWLIDACVRMTVLAMFGGVAFDLLGQVGMAMVLVVVFVLTWFYPVMFEVLWNGQTIGKRVLGIRVVAADGAPVGWMGAFVRNLLRAVDMLPALYATGLVAALFDPWGRRLGDLVAGTLVVHVVHAPPAGMIEPIPPQPPALALEAEEQRLKTEVLALRQALDERLKLRKRLNECDDPQIHAVHMQEIEAAQQAFDHAKLHQEKIKTADSMLKLARQAQQLAKQNLENFLHS